MIDVSANFDLSDEAIRLIAADWLEDHFDHVQAEQIRAGSVTMVRDRSDPRPANYQRDDGRYIFFHPIETPGRGTVIWVPYLFASIEDAHREQCL